MKRHLVRNYLRSFGVLKPQRASVRITLELVVVAALIIGGMSVWRTVDGYAEVNRQGPEQQRALAIVAKQGDWLHTNVGIAPGEQCFDTSGVPRSSSEPGARCSYYPDGQRAGCLAGAAPFCYSASITTVSTTSTRYEDRVVVSYVIRVRWDSGAGPKQTSLTYQVQQSDWTASGDNLSAGQRTVRSVSLPEPTPVVTDSGLLAINRLSDIPGGAAVGVSAGDCHVTKSCPAANAYGLAGSFLLTTNVPDMYITGCTWDFGDGSAPRTIGLGSTGCMSGQMVSHDYSAAWQLQNLPPYSMACQVPFGESLDTYAFETRVTLHTQEGTDVMTKTPFRLILPRCS